MNYADFFIPENPGDAPLLEQVWADLANPDTTTLWYPSSGKDLSPAYWAARLTRPAVPGAKHAEAPPVFDYESALAAARAARRKALRLRDELDACKMEDGERLERQYEDARAECRRLERLAERSYYEGARDNHWPGAPEVHWDALRERGTLPSPDYLVFNSFEAGFYESAGRRLLETGRPVRLRPPNHSTSYHTRGRADFVLKKYAPILRRPALPHYEPNKRSKKLGAYLELVCRDKQDERRAFKLLYFNYENLLFYRNVLHLLGWRIAYLCGVCCGIWEGGNFAPVCELAENEAPLPGENPRRDRGRGGRPFSLIRALRPAYVMSDVLFYKGNGSNYWDGDEQCRLEESGLAYSKITSLGQGGYAEAFLYQMRYAEHEN